MAEAKSGKKPTIFAPPFLTSRYGYKLILSLSPNGDGKAKGRYMSGKSLFN
jgi:TNF receptor-associated factor 4